MPNTCENCAHWQPVAGNETLRNGVVGECRYAPPSASYTWPRTRPDGYCSCHAPAARFAQAQGETSDRAPVTSDRLPATGNRKKSAYAAAVSQLPLGG